MINKSVKSEIVAVLVLLLLFFMTWWIVSAELLKYVPWVDVPLHFLGGFFVAMFFINFLHRAIKAERSTTKDLLIVLGASLFVGVAWEIFEYSSTRVLPSIFSVFRGGDLFDTLKDLVVDGLGAFAAFIIMRRSS